MEKGTPGSLGFPGFFGSGIVGGVGGSPEPGGSYIVPRPGRRRLAWRLSMPPRLSASIIRRM